ncbi:hypothetical protein [Billgrantia endophytica]|uniref:hypothetical protein n=1 Tax=Billgrantia endophytica TaxID=2033802 RepID=UPI0013FD1EB1|nr:hypothetical protein [Halomonas endophytica]
MSICPPGPADTIGAIQPHGCLIAIDTNWHSVRLASANLSHFFSLSPAEALGQPPERVLGSATVAALAKALTLGAPGVAIVSGRPDSAPSRLYATAHTTAQYVILEVEPLEGHFDDLPGLGAIWSARIAQANSEQAVLARLLRAFRVLTGFESVAMYGPGRDGRIERQTRDEAEDPIAPADGFPIDNTAAVPLLMIDSLAEPAGLIGTQGAAPDLSCCALRLAPLTIRAWLGQRQARTALALGLSEADRHWGVILCQDRRPRHLAPPLRHLLQQLAQTAAQRHALLHERREARHHRHFLGTGGVRDRRQWLRAAPGP